MSAQSNLAPIIIKKKKVVAGGGHHGGAWKVAYADFVTAMMAFFLLMWLLNATTEQQKKGVADYFSPTIAINRVSGGGDGNFGGESVFSEMTLPQNGTGATSLRPTEGKQARGEMGLESDSQQASSAGEGPDAEAFKNVENALQGKAGESMVSKDLYKHIITHVTDEGLIVELFDTKGLALFEQGSSEPTRALKDLSEIVASVAGLVTNEVAIGGHTRSQPVVLADNPVWDLSTARANSFRMLLEGRGLNPKRTQRMVGHADKSHVAPNPMSVRNNRLEIIFLRTQR